jgi:L-idonate 5-dehydrogenase
MIEPELTRAGLPLIPEQYASPLDQDQVAHNRYSTTDVTDAPLAVARRIGADLALNTTDPDTLAAFKPDKGYFDTVLEASGSGVALSGALEVVRPGGVIVQLGLAGGEMTLPINLLVAKEISLRGTFRFHEEFFWAVDFLGAGAIDIAPLLTELIPFADSVRAFDLAADRTTAMKVQLAF